MGFLRGDESLGPAHCVPAPTSVGSSSVRTHGTISGWRETTFDARFEAASVPYGPVAAKGLPPFPSGRRAVGDWVWKGVASHFSNEVPNLGVVVVVLPDTRGRITAAEWDGDVVRLEAESHVESELLEVQVSVGTGGESLTLLPQPLSPVSEWAIPVEATAVDTYLVHADGTLLSFLQLTRGEHYTAHTGRLSVREQAEVDLRAGESDQIEYKPFVDPGNDKEWELVETVVAFANTSGGRLYIGVNNAGIPAGEPQLRKAGKADVDSSLHLLVTRMNELIRERTKPVLPVSAEPISVFGSWIIVVDVPAGESRPYATIQNDVYIRKGASNFKADPLTELPSLYARTETAKAAAGTTMQRLLRGRRG